MRNLFAVFTLLFISLSATAFAGSKNAELLQKYKEANGPLTKQELLGGYLGRCYFSGQDDPVGMILTTITETKKKGDQPFDSWKMAVVLNVNITDPLNPLNAPASSNDNVAQDKINGWWNKPVSVVKNVGPVVQHISELTVESSDEGPLFSTVTATSKMRETYNVEACNNSLAHETKVLRVRKGQDGYLYGNVTSNAADECETQSSVTSCYFWKKLF